ncbi:phosphatase PAP2 family protein [Variovorax sp. J22R133]|uniref:phosphatase PAP2 family protein n=1 Tax=Variovorax brevis TaxID=3053503 RepID=UPI0025776156|nr:phosphatase PAP2 family protein [Variovorax sp. J22R133]MDM0112799.1 phosphatase PAP2 family protein [Variovorax sp. J22R133]
MTPRPSRSPLLAWTVLSLAIVLLWDASGLDVQAARWLGGGPSGFPLRDNRFLVLVMHEAAKDLSWVLAIGLVVAIQWPLGFLRQLSRSERAQLALTVIGSVVAISLLKNSSRTSCPWDLDAFGGVAHYVSHWSWGARDGGPGKCFPAGHASAAFAYVGGYFVLRRRLPQVARWWLICAIAAGFVLGLMQQMRGAHYMSHTLWTGWVCWVVGLVVDVVVSAIRSGNKRLMSRKTEQTI